MSTKRPAPAVHPSRASQVPSNKRQKTNAYAGTSRHKSFKKTHAVNDLKASIRSLTRLLNNKASDLPATTRIEKERALQTAKHDLARATAATERSKMIGRYHRVRFFDRKKAMKKLKQAEKDGQGVEEARVDLNYALYYPLTVAYVSLFPSKKGDGAQGEEDEGKTEDREDRGDAVIREMVVKCMEEGTLEALKNGEIEVVPVKVKPKKILKRTSAVDEERPRKDKATKRAASNTADEDVEESDDETGGGFFE